MTDLLLRLKPEKDKLEKALGLQLDWYASDNDYRHIDSKHGLINYQLTTFLGDDQPHYMEVTLSVVLTNLDVLNFEMFKLGYSMTQQVQYDSDTSPLTDWQKKVMIL